MIRLGLIGNGKWGQNYPKAAFEAGNCTVTDVAGRDWRKLLDSRIDAFIVATPPDSHEEICCELLMRGRPVMVEKPLALNVAAADRIAEAADKTQWLVNHQHLFAPAYEELRDRAAGWKRVAAFGFAGNNGPRRSYSALWDYGPHDVAMSLGVRGLDADLVVGYVRKTAGRYEFGFRRTSAGIATTLSVWNDAAPKTHFFKVSNGDCASLIYDDMAPSGLKLTDEGIPVPISTEKPLTRAVSAFAEAVRTGRTDWRFGRFGVEVVRILADAERMIAAN